MMTVKRAGKRALLFALLAALLLLGALLAAPPGRADDDDHGERRHGGEHERRRDRWVFMLKHAVEPVTNATYQKECGACHMAYQPALLPARSWEALFAHLENHFGHDASLPEKTVQELSAYTMQNAAENSRGEVAYKILRRLDNSAPQRITEVPYIRHKHREVAPAVFERKAVGSRANCAACHRSAEQGLYDEDEVVIPR